MKTIGRSLAVLAVACAASGAQAIVLPPGYTDSLKAVYGGSVQAFGNVVDVAGIQYVTGNFSNAVFRVSGGTATVYACCTASESLGLAARGGFLYVGTQSGQLFRLDLSLPAPPLVFIGNGGAGTANGLAFAPPGWGAHGGKLIVAGTGGVAAFDLGTSTSTLLTGGFFSNGTFTLAGQLLVVDSSGNQVRRVNPDGSSSVFSAVVGNPDGIAVNPNNGEIFISAPDSQTFTRFAADGTPLGSFATGAEGDSGWYPGVLGFSTDGTKLFWSRYFPSQPSGKLHEITGFAGAGFNCSSLNPQPVGQWGVTAGRCGNFASNTTVARYESTAFNYAAAQVRGAANYAYEVEVVNNRPRQPSAATSIFFAGSPMPLWTAAQWWDRAISFNISGNGKYSIFRYNGAAKPVPLQAWTVPVGVVFNAPPASNLLRVDVIGASLEFRINGVLVRTLPNSYTLDQFGMGFVRSLAAVAPPISPADDWMEILNAEVTGLPSIRAPVQVSPAMQQANDAANAERVYQDPMFATKRK